MLGDIAVSVNKKKKNGRFCVYLYNQKFSQYKMVAWVVYLSSFMKCKNQDNSLLNKKLNSK